MTDNIIKFAKRGETVADRTEANRVVITTFSDGSMSVGLSDTRPLYETLGMIERAKYLMLSSDDDGEEIEDDDA